MKVHNVIRFIALLVLAGCTTQVEAQNPPSTSATCGNHECVSVTSSAITDPTAVSNLSLWLRSDLGVTVDYTGTVTSWNDQSGNGYNFTTTRGTKPTYAPETANFDGYPAVVFNGSQDLDNHNTVGSSSTHTTFVVAYETSQTGDQALLTNANWTATYAGAPCSSCSVTMIDFNSGSPDSYISNTSGVFSAEKVSNNNAFIVAARSDGSHHTVYLNGVQGAQESTSGNTVYVGNGNLGTYDCTESSSKCYYLTGGIAEVIQYHTALGSTDFDAVIAYLKARYNIPGNILDLQ